MGHTRFKKKKKRWTTQKKVLRGGATITKTKQVQQSFDTIHDFYSLERGLFGTGLDPGVDLLQRKLASMPAGDPKIAHTQTSLQYAQSRVPFIPLYKIMKAVVQYMIITLNSIKFDIPIDPSIHVPGSIHADKQFTKYTGSKKAGQLFYAGQGIPSSKISTSGIEIQGREYFEIPPGREWPKLSDMESSFINLAGVLFNLNDNPDQDTIHAYNTALGQPSNDPIPAGARLTEAHRIYMLCDAGANTYGKLAESVRALLPGGKAGQKIWDGSHGTLRGPRVTELVTPLTTADSASSNPYQDHEFVFVASGADINEFISDANLYTNDIYQIKYVRDQWNPATGLGFKLVVSRNGSNDVLFELVYGILGEGQTPFVRPAGSRAQPIVYNSQGPSAASLSGCTLLRALHSVPATPGIAAPAGVFQDIPEEKIGNPLYPLRSPQRVRDMVATTPLPALPPQASLREQIITELTRIMNQQNGVSNLCGTANMVDPYHLLGDRFGTFPPELWFDIKRGGDRDQVKAAHYLSQLRDASNKLVYPFIHFVTGDELAAKMAVELGLAVIYQANGNIRYWPKMFRFRPESRAIPAPYGIATQPAPDATNGQWAIAQWGGKQMRGGLRNPNNDIPSYMRIEDKDGVQYFFDNYNFRNSDRVIIKGINDQGQNNRPNIFAQDLWFNPSNYVVMKNQVQVSNPAVTQESLLADIRAQYQRIPQMPELPARQLTRNELDTIVERLSTIDYRLLSSDIKQAIINVIQGIQILHEDNRGIYQYDFINTLFGNNPQVNELDELIFRIVYDSKEDDGLEGAATIGENSPMVTVRPDAGGATWTIPALLDENLLDYDIAFMTHRFTQTLIQYCTRMALPLQEVRQEFITQCGIVPIVSYIQTKYADNAPNNLQQHIATAIMAFAQQSASSAAASAAASAATPSPRQRQPPSLISPSQYPFMRQVSPLAPASTPALAATPMAPSPAHFLQPPSRTPSPLLQNLPSTPNSASQESDVMRRYTVPAQAASPSATEPLLSLSPARPAKAATPRATRAKATLQPRHLTSEIIKLRINKGRSATLQQQQNERRKKRNAAVSEKRETRSRLHPPPIPIQGQGGGKRHTKKKHHKRKKRETQKKRSY